MSEYVKLTNADCTTYGTTTWTPGVRVECADRDAPLKPCSPGAIHCYAGETQAEALALAAMMDPVHGGFGEDARVFVFFPMGQMVVDVGDKTICRAGCIDEELVLPEPTTEQRVEFCIRAVLCVRCRPACRAWALAWLRGDDRSAKAAKTAWSAMNAWGAARNAAANAARSAVDAAANTAWSAAFAAKSAASAAGLATKSLWGTEPSLASLALAVLENRGDEWSATYQEDE